ncbi:hypothetical protein, variant [Verruconis gallopava]|nr:hypothetical protein, variant [Verruconis gallopava]KIW08730.1 hypothetical protein, variant [Verruconis gallopava]
MSQPPSTVPVAQHYLKYTALKGFFVQDEPSKIDKDFDYAKSNLGLIDRKYPSDTEPDSSKQTTQWQRLENYIQTLNSHAAEDEQYKLLYFGRHGEGEHNVAEAKYGTEAWDCYWSKLEGDGELKWADAHLTPEGEQQALTANKFWAKALKEEKIPAPESYYSSPLDRCCNTASLTFEGLDLPKDKPFKPLIKELMREVVGVHTCDRRSSATAIKSRWPNFTFEPNFAEEDPLWVADIRESDSQLDQRIKTLLDDIFTNDKHTYISLTSHSGAIGGFLRVLGHEPFGLQTGGVIPVLVKAERVRGQPPPVKVAPGIPPPTCPPPPGV